MSTPSAASPIHLLFHPQDWLAKAALPSTLAERLSLLAGRRVLSSTALHASQHLVYGSVQVWYLWEPASMTPLCWE